jgi:TonB-linked SusC/RagA family outer membrane protein
MFYRFYQKESERIVLYGKHKLITGIYNMYNNNSKTFSMRKIILVLSMCMVFSITTMAQVRVTGTVTSLGGETISGATVLEKGTQNGVISGFNGEYTIEVASSNATLVFSFVGMATLDIQVNNRSRIDVEMESIDIGLDEVVVTALGVTREKKALGYSVTEVDGDDIAAVKETNAINSLQGRVAGLVITQSAAGPGSGSRVVIRGNNSLTGENQPLYIVDGVPMDNSGFGSANDDGTANFRRDDSGTGISDLNPDDIESMSVLKGPNASALYGSRAANGVIYIVTKKGSKRRGLGITFTSNITFDSPLILPEFQDTYGQGQEGNVPDDLQTLRNSGSSWGPKMDGSDKLYWNGETKPYSPQPDNVKDFFETGSNIVNTLSFDGGTEVASARFSYTNVASNSILPNSGLTKHNFNLRSLINFTDDFSLDARATYFFQEARRRPSQGTEGIMAYLYPIPRNTIIDDLKDYQDPETLNVNSYADGLGNPYWILFNDKQDDIRHRFQGFVKLNADFTDYLTGFIRVGTDFVNQNIENVESFGHWFYPEGRFNYRDVQVSETNVDFLLTYNDRYGDDFGLNVSFGGNHSYRTYKNNQLAGEQFKIPSKATDESAKILTPTYDPLEQKIVNSLYGILSFSFKNWLYLDATGRNDWSSTLPENNWSFFYPSVSFSFLFNDMFDMDDELWNLIKLRLGWAQVGNDTDVYQLNDNIYELEKDNYLDLTILKRPSNKLNPNLEPERVTSFEIGAELVMFSNRLYADLALYNIISNNLIMDIPVPAATGYSTFRENVGEITNKGIEFLVGGIPVQTNDFAWDVSFNFAKNKNKLVELIEDLDNFVFSTNNAGSVVVLAKAGGGYGDIYGNTYETTDDGQIVVDASGRPQITSDKVYLGNYQPDWTMGFNNSFTYKNWKLNFLIDGRFGGQLYSGTDAAMDDFGISTRTLDYRETGLIVDGVVNVGTSEDPVYEPNTTNVTAEQYFGRVSDIPSRYIWNQTNVRLRQLTLSYTFPRSMLNDLFIKGASISFIGRNLFFFYKDIENFDPESSYSTSNFAQGMLYYNLPTTRSLGFSINLKF